MEQENANAERWLRFILREVDPQAAAKRRADEILEHLYGAEPATSDCGQVLIATGGETWNESRFTR